MGATECGSGQYLDTETCKQCDPTCGECTSATECVTCYDFQYQYLQANSSCTYCASGYRDNVDHSCKACHASCGSFCLNSTATACLSCPTGKVLDVDTLTCLAACPTGYLTLKAAHPMFGNNYTYCRKKVWYIDPDAKPIQLGTKQFPYKLIHQAALEIFYNQAVIKFQFNYEFFLKANRTHHLFKEATSFVYMINGVIKPYDMTTVKPLIKYLEVPRPASELSGHWIVLYGRELNINLNLVLYKLAVSAWVESGFHLYLSTMSFESVRIEYFSDIDYNVKAYAGFILSEWILNPVPYTNVINIIDVDVKTNKRLFASSVPLRMKVKNVYLDLVDSPSAFWIADISCGFISVLPEVSALEMTNVTFTGSATGYLIRWEIFGPNTFTDIKFKDLKITGNQNTIIFKNTDYFCLPEANAIANGTYNTDIVMDRWTYDNVTGIIGIQTNFQTDQFIKFRYIKITLTNLVIMNSKVSGMIYQTDNLYKPSLMKIANVTITNSEFNDPTRQAMINIMVPQPELSISNVTITSSTIAQQLVYSLDTKISITNLKMSSTQINLPPTSDELFPKFLFMDKSSVDYTFTLQNLELKQVGMSCTQFLETQTGSTITKVRLEDVEMKGKGLYLLSIKNRVSAFTLDDLDCRVKNRPGKQLYSRNFLWEVTTTKTLTATMQNVYSNCSNLLVSDLKFISNQPTFTKVQFKNVTLTQYDLVQQEAIFQVFDILPKNKSEVVLEGVHVSGSTLAADSQFMKVSGQTDVGMAHCVIEGLQSPSELFKVNTFIFTTVNPLLLTLNNLTVQHSSIGNVFVIDGNVGFKVKASKFTNLTSTLDGVILYTRSPSATLLEFDDTLFTDIKGKDGALFNIQSSLEIKVINSKLQHNVASGMGGIFVLNQASLTLQNSLVTNNSASKFGVGFIGSSIKQTLFDNVTFSQNLPLTHPAIQVENGNLKLVKPVLDLQEFPFAAYQLSQLWVESPEFKKVPKLTKKIVYASNSKVTLKKVSLDEYSHTLGNGKGLFEIMIRSTLVIEDLNFTNSKSNLIHVTDVAAMAITKLRVEHVRVDTTALILVQGSLAPISFSQLTINNISDFNGTPAVVRLSKSILSVSSSSFTSLMNVQVINAISGRSQVTLDQCTITSIKAQPSRKISGLIVLNGEKCNSIINNSTFSKVEGGFQGGVIFHKQSSILGVQYSTQVFNSTFKHISSETEGGVIYTSNVVLKVDNSTFANTTAVDGGAINIHCGEQVIVENLRSFCQPHIKNSTFTNTSAKFKGGAISYDLLTPTHIQTNSFTNCSAGFYGPNYAGYPSKIMNASKLPDQYVSGQKVNSTIQFGIFDDQNQPIKWLTTQSYQTKDQSQILSMSAASNDTLSSLVSGVNKNYTVEGISLFTDLNFIGYPGKTSQILIQTSVIDSTKVGYAFPSLGQSASHLNFKVKYRMCISGEQFRDQKCLLCPRGTYSLVQMSTKCNGDCPEGAECLGGNKLTLNKDYWRSSAVSDEVIKCLSQEACLGGVTPRSCAKGYKGNLCHECYKVGGDMFARTNVNDCVKCESAWVNAVKVSAIYIGYVIGIILLIWSSIRGTLKNIDHIVLMRILTSYFQVISISNSFNLKWPSYVEVFLQSISIMGEGTDRVFSFECFGKAISPSTNEFLIRIITFAISPFLMIIPSLILVFIFLLVRRKFKAGFKKYTIVTCVVVVYVLYPSITNTTFSIFSCKTLDQGKSWATRDLQVECRGSTHLIWMLLIGLPQIFLWVIGIPFFEMGLLVWYRKKLDDEKFLPYYGFFYKGLRKEVFYWEIVETMIKVILIILNVFMTNVTLKVLVALMVLFIKVDKVVHLRPYREKYLNFIVLASTYASFFVLFSGMFYVNSVDSNTQQLFFFLILFSNSIFIIAWVYYFIKAVYRKGRHEVHFAHGVAVKRGVIREDSKVSQLIKSNVINRLPTGDEVDSKRQLNTELEQEQEPIANLKKNKQNSRKSKRKSSSKRSKRKTSKKNRDILKKKTQNESEPGKVKIIKKRVKSKKKQLKLTEKPREPFDEFDIEELESANDHLPKAAKATPVDQSLSRLMNKSRLVKRDSDQFE